MANYGDYEYSNVMTEKFNEPIAANYVEYEEGMYYGYRYYETAYDMALLIMSRIIYR